MKPRDEFEIEHAYLNRAVCEIVTAVQDVARALDRQATASEIRAEQAVYANALGKKAVDMQAAALLVQEQLAGSSAMLEQSLIATMTSPKNGGSR